MQFTKILGLAAVGALLALAAPAERANALSLSNPGAAAAVQDDARLATTEVHWRHHRHHRWHRWHHRIATTIIVTGVAGKRDSWRRDRTGPLHCGPVSISRARLETGEIAARYL